MDNELQLLIKTKRLLESRLQEVNKKISALENSCQHVYENKQEISEDLIRNYLRCIHCGKTR